MSKKMEPTGGYLMDGNFPCTTWERFFFQAFDISTAARRAKSMNLRFPKKVQKLSFYETTQLCGFSLCGG